MTVINNVNVVQQQSAKKRGNYIDAGATSNINEKYTQNSYADVTAKFIRK